jgi:DNA-binding FrmR family transcriptional regulator
VIDVDQETPSLSSAEAAVVTPHEGTRPMMDEALKADLRRRLSKIAGQVLGINGMVDQDRYCVDVLDQIAAAQKALDGVAKKVMRNYLERCVTDAISGGDPLIYDELMGAIFRHR